MVTLSFLLNPRARVYNLRFLLIANIPIILLAFKDILYDVRHRTITIPVLGLASGIIIWVHHIFAILHWTLRGLAVVDLAMVLIEIGGFIYLTSNPIPNRIPNTWGVPHEFGNLLPSILPLFFLFFSLLFRITTILKNKEKLLVQRLIFLGCCAKLNPPYTVASILLNRSLTRPLVRGESKYIIIARAIVLSSIGVGVPAFGIYATTIKPAIATPTTTLTAFPQIRADLPGLAMIFFAPSNYSFYSYSWDASVTAYKSDSDAISCPIGGQSAICPCAWSEIEIISFSVVVPSGAGFLRVWFQCSSAQCEDYLLNPDLSPVPLLPGSQLFGSLAWSQRQTVSQSQEPSDVIFSPEVHGLQQNTSAEGNITSLTLSVVRTPIRYYQDTVDASTLSGIATFGGFWTFVNGTFALFFGANIVYFVFGRRPLSALGVVHLFQRRALVRNWYEDFPAIQTEGGLPGSENAGIVAFIRERLVDLGENPRDIEERPRASKVREKIRKYSRTFPWKKKIQRFKSQSKNARVSPQESKDFEVTHTVVSPTHEASPINAEPPEPHSRRGYILDDIPLLHIDSSSVDGAEDIQEIKDTFSP
ncbi:Short-chain dehydrogenase/reductase family protein [Mycena sanguinolenta]|uniref:Short-chain dehydrogenase/reductase family protein n=1 Tax=Mycena sanguinolenta TaxID=230812 RepID=A0A8H6ZI70_9AGAR|nr:Short-chain dehydrogenase/reductase family protein [Mycena sanguinolenta]